MKDYEFTTDLENHDIGDKNIYRLYYLNYMRSYMTDGVHMVNYPYKPFLLPSGMERDDAFKVLSYLTDFIERREDVEECSLKSVAMLDSILDIDRFGFMHLNEKIDDEDIVDLFTVTGRIHLFKNSPLYQKYFDWYTPGITEEEVIDIYKKCNMTFSNPVENKKREMYSNAEDCHELASELKSKLKDKIRYTTSTYLEIINGEFHSLPYKHYNLDYNKYQKDTIKFAIKYQKDVFLRLTIYDDINKLSLGHKLAVLSDFYEALSNDYGIPTLFYTIKDDEDGSLFLEWAFKEKDETINEFKYGNPFDDGVVDKLIVFGESKENDDKSIFSGLNEITKDYIAKSFGLPYELILLMDDNIEDYIYYKKGKKIIFKSENMLDDDMAKKLILTKENEKRK